MNGVIDGCVGVMEIMLIWIQYEPYMMCALEIMSAW